MSYAPRVLLKTALTPLTGYGNDGLGLAIALQDAGWDVSLDPSTVNPPLPARVAALLTRPIEPPYDLLLHHASPIELGLYPGMERSAKLKMAWTMWEFSSMGPDFEGLVGPSHFARPFSLHLASYDVIGAYDDVSAQALSEHVATDGPKLIKIQGGYWADQWHVDPRTRVWSGTFKFLMNGAMGERKNPFSAIEAFKLCKEQHGDAFDAELHIKTTARTLHPKMEEAYPWLKIHYATWTHEQMVAYYLSGHCFVAPSWGEGKNLPALEAQTTGIPVLATRIGGHAEWMSDDWSYNIPFELGEHIPGVKSARANVEGFAAKLWEVYSDRELCRRKGELAARTIPSMCDWSKVVERLRFKLMDLGL
jgi:glycosyltransferase involved in cell wall biosynthesis